jgi:hypothetical protein
MQLQFNELHLQCKETYTVIQTYISFSVSYDSFLQKLKLPSCFSSHIFTIHSIFTTILYTFFYTLFTINYLLKITEFHFILFVFFVVVKLPT